MNNNSNKKPYAGIYKHTSMSQLTVFYLPNVGRECPALYLPLQSTLLIWKVVGF